MNEDAGKPKWINVDDLDHGGMVLTKFEPNQTVRIKGFKFTVQRIVLDPPNIVLAPISPDAAKAGEEKE